MNKEIAERIEMIKEGKIPEGYNCSHLGIYPSTWNVSKLSSLCNKITDGTHKTPLYKNEGIKFISAKNIIDNKINWNDVKYISEEEHNELIKRCNPEDGDIVLSKSGSLGAPALINKTFEFSLFESLALIKYKRTLIDGNYLFQYLLSPNMQKVYHLETKGLSIKHLHLTEINNFKLILPKLDEQKKISNILKLWDRALELKEKLLQEKQKQKQGLIERLLSGFDKKWNKIRLDKIIKESKELSIENNQYDILSVTKKGIYLQSEYFNRQIASENNVGYKVVRKNELVFSTMNLWMGSIDIMDNYDIGIVSPACKVFKLEKDNVNVDVNFMKYFIKSSYMMNLYKLNSEQGASVVRRNLDLAGLLSTKIKLPDICNC